MVLIYKSNFRDSQASSNIHPPGHLLLKVAALLLVMASAGVAGFYALKSSDHTVSEQLSAERVTVATDFTEKKTISLSDGSEIILAAGSLWLTEIHPRNVDPQLSSGLQMTSQNEYL